MFQVPTEALDMGVVRPQERTSMSAQNSTTLNLQECENIEFRCFNRETCCAVPDTTAYGCCEFPNAVCCSDGMLFIRNFF